LFLSERSSHLSFKKGKFLRFSSFFFTAALGGFGFCLCGARNGRGRCARPTLRIRNFQNGERFRKNSNVFQTKVGAASAAVHSPRHLRSAFGLVNILKSRLELAKSE
jgi:hypothetical protein